MKCLKCGFEWNEKSANKMLTTCPICGEKIQSNNDENEYFMDALNKIIDRCGEEILNDPKSLIMMFKLHAPKFRMEIIRLQLLANTGVWDRLYQSKGKSEKVQLNAINGSVNTLRVFGLDESMIFKLLKDLCMCFRYADNCLLKLDEKYLQKTGKDAHQIKYPKKGEKIIDEKELEKMYRKGKKAKRLKKFDLAYFWFNKAAEQGYAPALWEKGNCYVNGQGTIVDYSEAVKCFCKAADQGYVDAQNSLGYCYANGKGVKKNRKESAKWYRKSAEQGNDIGQERLAIFYEIGFGVKQDYKEAVKWYKKAADQGNSSYALYRLGVLYEKGKGIEEDLIKAKLYYEEACKKGSEGAKRNLERLV